MSCEVYLEHQRKADLMAETSLAPAFAPHVPTVTLISHRNLRDKGRAHRPHLGSLDSSLVTRNHYRYREAVLVMALCPWCKLAAGSQVAHMTVIDVQVFNSSHTETLQQHTHAYGATDTHRSSMHMHVYTLHFFTCTHRSLCSSLCC
ncbi:unnamed protein product [Tetraodon nigroviridis]|uniref:(spotted green pufferfish) hypothetical protein n=1 Tax=Tetraodon nigroviridis TaxID=99883 RepID=Q4SI23_TETNG|nr:unnamed protein product [Tetraodon nigroviridis]